MRNYNQTRLIESPILTPYNQQQWWYYETLPQFQFQASRSSVKNRNIIATRNPFKRMNSQETLLQPINYEGLNIHPKVYISKKQIFLPYQYIQSTRTPTYKQYQIPKFQRFPNYPNTTTNHVQHIQHIQHVYQSPPFFKSRINSNYINKQSYQPTITESYSNRILLPKQDLKKVESLKQSQQRQLKPRLIEIKNVQSLKQGDSGAQKISFGKEQMITKPQRTSSSYYMRNNNNQFTNDYEINNKISNSYYKYNRIDDSIKQNRQIITNTENIPKEATCEQIQNYIRQKYKKYINSSDDYHAKDITNQKIQQYNQYFDQKYKELTKSKVKGQPKQYELESNQMGRHNFMTFMPKNRENDLDVLELERTLDKKFKNNIKQNKKQEIKVLQKQIIKNDDQSEDGLSVDLLEQKLKKFEQSRVNGLKQSNNKKQMNSDRKDEQKSIQKNQKETNRKTGKYQTQPQTQTDYKNSNKELNIKKKIIDSINQKYNKYIVRKNKQKEKWNQRKQRLKDQKSFQIQYEQLMHLQNDKTNKKKHHRNISREYPNQEYKKYL